MIFGKLFPLAYLSSLCTILVTMNDKNYMGRDISEKGLLGHDTLHLPYRIISLSKKYLRDIKMRVKWEAKTTILD